MVTKMSNRVLYCLLMSACLVLSCLVLSLPFRIDLSSFCIVLSSLVLPYSVLVMLPHIRSYLALSCPFLVLSRRLLSRAVQIWNVMLCDCGVMWRCRSTRTCELNSLLGNSEIILVSQINPKWRRRPLEASWGPGSDPMWDLPFGP